MRRPGLLIVGMMLATGAGLALATPASAAPSTNGDHPRHGHCDNYRHHHHHFYNDCYDHNHGHGWGNGWGDDDCYYGGGYYSTLKITLGA
jgi:hypothetical protein